MANVVFASTHRRFCHEGRELFKRTAFIEWIAQSFAFVQAARNAERGSGTPVRKAFLVSIQKAELLVEPDDPSLKPPTVLSVSVYGFRDIGPIILFDGEIRGLDGSVLARANLRVYHTPED